MARGIFRLLFWLLFTPLLLAQTASESNGVWSLNRSLSEFPKDLGFSIPVPSLEPDGQAAPASGGGRGRRGSTGGRRTSDSPILASRESYEDAQRVRVLTDEVRNPPTRLTIVDNTASITLTNELGQSRILHPNGHEEAIEVQGVPMTVTTVRDGARLVATYHVEANRDVRYAYSFSTSPARLTVE